MGTAFDLENYLAGGVRTIVSGILRTTRHNFKESAFMARYAAESLRAEKRRARAAAEGRHVPPFLIASITTRCNLHCKGCYARANHGCFDGDGPAPLSAAQWDDIFRQAEELGVGFILLAGGEPFTRQDVLRAAGGRPALLFPIFTNGTLLDAAALKLLDEKRNLIPILSVEGARETTDARRGAGVYETLQSAMAELSARQLIFGASVTVTGENMTEVLSDAFLDELYGAGCRAVIYVEYVPVDHRSAALAPDDAARAAMAARLDEVRRARQRMLIVSFPGDEGRSGGCLAAGRGFFHINAFGGAEPCPFSPYSDISAADTPLIEVLDSPLFQKLRDSGRLTESHVGGCVLFEQEAQVKAWAAETGEGN